MLSFVCALAGRVVAVVTRFVLNRILRKYLKEKLGRVTVHLTQCKIDFNRIVLEGDIVSVYFPGIKSCQISNLEVGFVRKGLVIRLRGLVVQAKNKSDAIRESNTLTTEIKHRAALGLWKRIKTEIILIESQIILYKKRDDILLRTHLGSARMLLENGFVKPCKLSFEDVHISTNNGVKLVLDRGYIQAVEDFRVARIIIDPNAATLTLSNGHEEDFDLTAKILNLRLDIWLWDQAFEVAISAIRTVDAFDLPHFCRLNTGRIRLRLDIQLNEIVLESQDTTSLTINLNDAPLLRRWYRDLFPDHNRNFTNASSSTLFDHLLIKFPRLEAQFEFEERDQFCIAFIEPRFEHRRLSLSKVIVHSGAELDLILSGNVKAQSQSLEFDTLSLGLDDWNSIDNVINRSRKLLALFQLVVRSESNVTSSITAEQAPFQIRCGNAKFSVSDDTAIFSELEYNFDGETDILLATGLQIVVSGFIQMYTRRATQTAVVDDESDAANAERGRDMALELSRKRCGGGAIAAALRRVSATIKRTSESDNKAHCSSEPTLCSRSNTNSKDFSFSDLRMYLALYDSKLEYEAVETCVTAKLSLGFARLATTLTEHSAVCSTRVRDLELDLAKYGLDASIATLDVLDAVAKLDQRTNSSLNIELGTLRTYACHDSLKAFFDLVDDVAQHIGSVRGNTDSSHHQDKEEEHRCNITTCENLEFFVQNPDAEQEGKEIETTSIWEEKEIETTTAGAKIVVVEDYLGSIDVSSRRRSNENVDTLKNIKRNFDDSLEMELTESSLRNLDDIDQDEESVSSFVDDEDFAEPKAGWYSGEFDTSTLVKDHVQRPLRSQSEDDGFFQRADKFHFELKCQGLVCRFFAGSEWQQSEIDHVSKETESNSQRLADLLIGTDLIDITNDKTRPQPFKRGRLVERLCELSLTGGRVRFAHPPGLRAFRLEVRLEDFGVSENVSVPENAPKLAICHWLSRRHPRLSSEPMLLLEASGVDDHGIGSTTNVKLKVVPLRCRLDAHFLAFIDAFAGALENLNDHTEELGSDDDSMCDPKEYIFGDRELHGISSSASSSGDERGNILPREAIWIDNGVSTTITNNMNDAPCNTSIGGDDRHLSTLQVAAWKLKLDYRPRGVDANSLRRGSISELLHLFALERVELDLRKAEASAPSLPEALDRVRLKWSEELRNEQLHRLVAGAEPLRPVANVSASALDVVAAPIAESVTSGGRPLRALKQSSRILGEITAVEAARASRKLASGIANVLDHASEPAHRGIRNKYERRRSSANSNRRRRWDELSSRGSGDDPNLQRAKDAFLHGIDGAASACAHAIKRPSVSL
uniref:Autophagy-related protein 2 n=1 Tax=Aureoumbra lagunensis TaxID=44058 RepID=A0A7S3JUH8_9STRA